MIFVPKKEDCAIWNDRLDDYIWIYYEVNPTEESNAIAFKWWKRDGKAEEPHYLELEEVLGRPVLSCSFCVCQPQLRYNDIIKKWYCCCSSTALCTKNDDEDELKTMLLESEFTEENGFCDDPISAILRWNIHCAEDFKQENEKLLKDRTEGNKDENTCNE